MSSSAATSLISSQRGATPSSVVVVDPVWTEENIAAYLQCSTAAVSAIRAEDPSFPEPRRVRPRLPRWDPEEVRRWFRGSGTPSPGTTVGYARAEASRAVVPKAAARRTGRG